MPRSTRAIQAKVVEVSDYKAQPRRFRKPREYFNLKSRPFEIVPFLCHPVLPGETLGGAFLQSSAVSDPVANRLIGWWKEYHIFYVPLRALTHESVTNRLQPDHMESMFLDPSYDPTVSYGAAANSVPYYTFKTGINWIYMLTSYIVERWFRDENEDIAGTDQLWDDYWIAQTDQKNWANSLKEESAGADDSELAGVDGLEELDILPGFETIYAQWELMRDQGMTDLTYKDYLRSYGITPPKDADLGVTENEPMIEAERLRSIMKWANPTLAPQVGASSISSVLYWRSAERFTKKRFFGEPGFIFGVTVTRPKIYLGNQKGHFAGLLGRTLTWLPATLNHLPYSSVTEQLDSATDGIIQGGDEDYWLDMKDGFLHGGQFVNHTMGAAANHGLGLPVVSDLNKKYPTEAMMNSLFTTSDGSASYIYEDGSVHLEILGKLSETTPGTGTAD